MRFLDLLFEVLRLVLIAGVLREALEGEVGMVVGQQERGLGA